MTILAAPAAVAATRWAEIDGRRVAVDVYGDPGDRTPVVLLHGIPGWRGTWKKVAATLCRSRGVVVPDLLGFGESDAPAARHFHARAQAEMILALLEVLEIRAAHLVGHDFGGPTAVAVYRLAPERVRSLSLASTNLFTDTPVPVPLRIARVPGVGRLAFRVMFSRAGLERLWHVAVADKAAFPFAEYRRMLRWRRGLRWTREVFLASMRDLPGLYREVQDTLSAVRVPATVVWGDCDPFFPLAIGRRTARAIPGASFVALSACGHFVPEERPEGFARAIEGVVSP